MAGRHVVLCITCSGGLLVLGRFVHAKGAIATWPETIPCLWEASQGHCLDDSHDLRALGASPEKTFLAAGYIAGF
jgi:hypothetical protein